MPFALRGRRDTPQSPPPVSPDTLAGAAALGQTSGSGAVAPWNAFPTAVLTPGAVEMLAPSGYQPTADLPPDSVYADRALRGGVQTLSAFGSFHEGAPFLGGYRVMGGRPALAQFDGEQIEAQSYVEMAEIRESPGVQSLCRNTSSLVTFNASGLDGMEVL